MTLGRRRAIGLTVALLLVGGIPWVSVRAVDSHAMAPVLSAGDVVIWNPLIYRVRMPYRGDVVVCRDDRGRTEILRVAGIGGDTVEVDGRQVRVNGGPPQPPQASDASDGLPRGRWLVPGGSVFLLADSRPAARDSRHYGPVPFRRLLGQMVYRMAPFRYRGWL